MVYKRHVLINWVVLSLNVVDGKACTEAGFVGKEILVGKKTDFAIANAVIASPTAVVEAVATEVVPAEVATPIAITGAIARAGKQQTKAIMPRATTFLIHPRSL